MMAQKRLDELLREDQEPFHLKNYIADRRTQLRPSSQNQLQHLKKRKPISQTPKFPGKFCKNACFSSFIDSPDLRKSPLFEFASPAAKSPCRSPIFLHIPARTTALLLEAALRIQKQSKSTHPPKNHGFGLFGSVLKKLTSRNRKREIDNKDDVSVKDILTRVSSVGRKSRTSDRRDNYEVVVEQKSGRCSCHGSNPSSAVWSETNEDKSLEELETSSSGQSDQDAEEIFMCKDIDGIGDFGYCEGPFRFVLQQTPSPGHRTPDFLSPAASPCRTKTEENDKYDVESLKKLQGEGEEEEKEQCSPVSVLDAPFEDDEEGNEDDEEEDDDDFDMEGSYAIVQRAKQQLLQKLQRFEKLAGLDPIDLEKRMLENDNDEEDDEEEDDYHDQEEDQECNVREDFRFHQDWQIPKPMRLLVSDLIAEEEKQREVSDDQEMMKRVLERLESWRDVESNTIDMMVEQDFRKEFDLWKMNQEHVQDTAAEIELAIFGLLVDELWN